MQKTSKYIVTGLEEYDVKGDEMFIWAKNIGDEYHTIEELYEHRYALFGALIRIYDGYITPLGATPVTAWKSKLHSDGSIFDNFFIAGLRRRNLDGSEFSITYHLPISWWDKIKCMEIPRAPEWDGHTSKDVIELLGKL